VVLQSILLGGIGVALGWRPTAVGLLVGAVVIALGTVMFATLGLLLGGTLRAEIVLALANIVWFALLGIGSIVLLDDVVPDAVLHVVRLVPSGALTLALDTAVAGGVDWLSIAVLVVWTAIGGTAAVRWFRFT
jgi:ABC-2 type transport system permease protein